MDISTVKDLFTALLDFLIKMLKGLGVIESDEELDKSDTYKESLFNLLNAISASMDD